MANKQLPSPEVLRQLLRYEPNTGKLYWLPRTPDLMPESARGREWQANRFNAIFAGKAAFTALSDGYHVSNVLGRMIKAHRAAWAISHGVWPLAALDHINGIRSDNRISNLREVTRAENNRNVASARGASSAFVGVQRKRLKWAAQINIAGRSTHIGTYESEELAAAAYQERAAAEWGPRTTRSAALSAHHLGDE